MGEPVSTTLQFDAATHEYREDGVLIPSVTQVLAGVGITDYSMVPRAILEHKRAIGEQVHLACQFLDEGSLDWDTVDPDVLNYVLAYEAFKRQTEFTPRLNEYRAVGCVNGMKFGMTLDREGDINGKPYVIELKATAQIHPGWAIQLAAYDLGIADGLFRRRAAVHLKPDCKFSVEPYAETKDREVFLWALGVTWWKFNNLRK
jgi:hypothetical protein